MVKIRGTRPGLQKEIIFRQDSAPANKNALAMEFE